MAKKLKRQDIKRLDFTYTVDDDTCTMHAHMTDDGSDEPVDVPLTTADELLLLRGIYRALGKF